MKGKRSLRRLFSLIGALCLLVGCCMPAMAKRQEYNYTIRIFSGQQGRIDGQEMIQLVVPANSRIDLHTSAVTLLDDSKYYVKGFRESGKGTEEILGVGSRLSAFVATKDQDYVVAYGLRGTMVEYTVNFQDAQGNTLAPSETYMGNVGDRPVVAYLYIEGYQPQSYNLTKTLVEDPTQNVLTFVYTRVAATTNQGGTTTVINGAGATVVTPVTPTGGATTSEEEGGEGEGGEDETEPSEEEGDEDSSSEAEAIPDEEPPEAAPEEPAELIDIDEGEVPLANVNDTPTSADINLRSEGKIFPLWAKLVAGLLVLAILGTGFWFLIFFRRKKDEERPVDISEITDINAIKDLMDDDKKL